MEGDTWVVGKKKERKKKKEMRRCDTGVFGKKMLFFKLFC
jgi:hypothetical protein